MRVFLLSLITCLILLTNFSHAANEQAPSLTPQQYQLLNQMSTALNVGNNPEALRLGETILTSKQGKPEQIAYLTAFTLRSLTPAYQELGQEQQLINQFTQLLNQQADVLDIESLQASRWLLVYLLIGEQQYPQALKQLELWWQLETNPKSEALYLRAVLLANLQRWSAADLWITQALQQENKIAWLNLGVLIKQQQQKWAQAATLQRRILIQQPASSNNWLQLAQFQLLAQQDNAALVTLELAQSLGYLSSEQLEQLALRLLSNQQPLRAAQILESLVQLDTTSIELQRLAAQAWLLTRQPEPTYQALERLAKNSANLTDKLHLGQWLLSRGEWAEAIQVLEPLVEQLALQPKTQEQAHKLKLALATAHLELNETQAATQILQQLLDTNEQAAAENWLKFIRAL